VRRRLRDFPDEAELAAMYALPHNARLYGYGHAVRVDCTIALAKGTCGPKPERVIDLSCGNAVIPRALAGHFRTKLHLGDFAKGYAYRGPIEQTLHTFGEKEGGGVSGLFILSETIEHLEDPDSVLIQIGSVADQLILSTPIDEQGAGTPEHIWAWGIIDVDEMLRATGWTPTDRVDLRMAEGYDYQIWRAQQT
jgi:hypothetical protein